MGMRNGTCVAVVLAWLLTSAVVPNAMAGDHFFVFGGGYHPTGNQISLEKNVQYFRRFLDDAGLSSIPQHYLFADGNDPGADLQYQPEQLEGYELNYLLANLLNQTRGLTSMRYRNHDLTDIAGPSTTESVTAYFDETASHLTKGDRLLIYYTGHGGKGENNDEYNTNFALWNRQSLKMKDFVKQLDRVPTETPIVMVLVQCYSGGFQNIIFNEGDPAKGLSANTRVGFMATVHSRPAAGCTADINEANYQEYSSYFWAALYGRSRLGEKVAKPDFDGDGHVSFDEAHAYALVTSDSIDVSVKTTDILLRTYSRTTPTDADKEAGIELLSPESDIAMLLSHASPVDRAVLEGLSQKVGLNESNRYAEAKKKMQDIEKYRAQVGKDEREMNTELGKIRTSLANELKKQWPELENAWHPHVHELLNEKPNPIAAFLDEQEDFARFKDLSEQVHLSNKEQLDMNRQVAKCERLMRVLENVALEANLAKVADIDVLEAYNRLQAAEHGTLTDVYSE